jgi:ribosomal protein S18 acetylase RimI-like enzyme
MTPEIRIAGPEALPTFIAFAEDAADWLWARGIRQWRPGSIRAEESELARRLGEGWLVIATVGGETVAGCLLTRLVPPCWQGRADSTAVRAAYLERLVVARTYAGRGLSRAVVGACEELAREERIGALRLDCWAGNEPLKVFYRGLGFRDVAELMSMGDRLCLFEKDFRDVTKAYEAYTRTLGQVAGQAFSAMRSR